MKTSAVSGLLFRSVLVASFGSLVACSSVLQATRINRPIAQLPVEVVADAPPESVNEKLLSMNNAQLLYSEAAPHSPIPMAPGYQWFFVVKQRSQNSPHIGYWQIKPIN